MAVPLFILSADIMNASKITDKLFEFANLLVGRLRGGLAHVNIVASMIFSGMSGSALADAAGPGKLEVDMMIKAGYKPGFAGALSATSAIIGPIIPPSIPMVIYGVVSNTSIGYLFIAGIIPGLAAWLGTDGRGRGHRQAAQLPDRAAADPQASDRDGEGGVTGAASAGHHAGRHL